MTRQWNYLASEPFQLRQLMTAALLRRFDCILELGSYKTPVYRFLEDEGKEVLAVDPMVFDHRHSGQQQAVTEDYRCLSMPPFGGRPYALVILGLDLPVTHKLKELLRGAEVAVIEYPQDEQWTRSRALFDQLVAEVPLNRLLQARLDLDGNDFGRYLNDNEWPPRTQRFVHVASAKIRSMEQLEGRNPFAPPLPEIDTRGSALVDPRFTASNIFPEADFDFSHGASQGVNYLGGALLYYTLAYMQRARVCVCLGSGGALVPRLMRQAQRDIGLAAHSRTVLVDGHKGGFGRPNWSAEDSFFRTHYPDVEVIAEDTLQAAARLSAQGVRIDYLHIDADHSLEGSLADFDHYLPLMQPHALITFHDTRPNAHASVTCWQAVEAIKRRRLEVVNLDRLGSGVAIIKAGPQGGTTTAEPCAN